MTKYGHAKNAVTQAVAAGAEEGWDKPEMLLALLVSSISEYVSVAGRDATRDALTYELNELGGGIDTQFIRSR